MVSSPCSRYAAISIGTPIEQAKARRSSTSLITETLGLVAHFFFSSRRRHTVSGRDWSSDVCSSDLRQTRETAARGYFGRVPEMSRLLGRLAETEARRVGKEGRSRRSPHH